MKLNRLIALAPSLVLVFSSSAAAVEPFCLDSGAMLRRGIPTAIANDDFGRVWVANGTTVSAFDVTFPSAPRLVDSFDTPSLSIDIDADGGRLAVLTRDGFALRSITSLPSHQILEKSTKGATEIHLDGNRLLLSGEEVELYDVSGTSPVLSFRQNAPTTTSAIAGDRVFTASDQVGLSILNATNGALIDRLAASALAIDASVPGDLYLAQANRGLSIVALDGSGPVLVGTIRPDIAIEGVTAAGKRVYAWGSDGIVIVDASDPSDPMRVGESAEGVKGLAASGGTVYTISDPVDPWGLTSDDGIAVKVLSSSSLSPIATIERTSGPVTGVDAVGEYRFVAAAPFFHVIDVSTPRGPAEIASLRIEGPFDLVRVRNGMAILYGGRWVHLIDVSNPAAPVYLSTWETLGLANGSADLAGNYLIEANRASGFHVVNIDDPTLPYQVGGLINDSRGQWQRVTGLDGVAYGAVSAGLKIVDIRTPDHPVIVNFIPLGGAREIEAVPTPVGDLLFVQNLQAIEIRDITDRYNPVLLSTIPLFPIVDFGISGTTAWVVSTDGRLARIDFSNPSSPTAEIVARELADPMQVDGTTTGAVVADGWSLQRILDPHLVSPLAPPVIEAERLRSGSALIQSSDDHTQRLEIEITRAGQPVTTTISREGRISIDEHDAFSARARFLRPCGAGPWSESVTVSAAPAIRFVGSGVRLVGIGQLPTTIGLRNDRATPAHVSLTSTSQIPGLPEEIDLPASSVTTLDVSVDAATLPYSSSTITLTASADDSQDEFVITVSRVSAGASVALTTAGAKVIPGVGSTPGARNTLWRSDLHMFCEASACSEELRYFPYGDDAASIATVTMSRNETLRIDDVIGSVFGGMDTSGWIEVSDISGESRLHGWTYNSGSASGEFGQRIPAAPQRGGRIAGLSESSRFRTNIGLINHSPETATVVLSLGSSGIPIATRTWQLAPFQSGQERISSAFPLPEGGEELTIDVATADDVVVYATRVDQETGDALFLYPSSTEPAGAGPYRYFIDPVGSTPGASESFWKTELRIAAGDQPSEFSLLFVPLDPAEDRVGESVSLAAGETISTFDLIADIFGDAISSSEVSGLLIITSDAPLTGWARVYNEGPRGTFGQYVPMRRRVESEAGMFSVEQGGQFRTNLGIAEISGLPATATIEVLDQRGELLGERTVGLKGLETFRWNGILRELGLEGLDRGSIVIRSGGEGTLSSWVSVVDNVSGDSRFEY